MQIGEAATASGMSAKMIRHYEAIGLLPDAGRRSNSYRDYDGDDVHRLRFVRGARELGFSMDRVRALLHLWSDRGRSNAEVKAIAREHVAELEDRIARMQGMVHVLHDLAERCDGSGRPDCPILQGLEGRA